MQNRSAAGARAFDVSGQEASKFAPPKIETRQTLAQLSFERSKAVDATSGAPIPAPASPASITMDDSTLSSLAEAIADSYAPPPMPTAPEITWEFDDPEITQSVGEDFTKHQSPGRYYIEETSPVFTDPSIYFSTDNFINRVDGFEPKKQAVYTQQPTNLHFGDSLKQMDFVRRQMVNLTGLAFLEDQVDYTQEIKNLYEKGIRYGQDMKLKSGVTLSKEQVDALQDDMVWAETIELRGTKVVIPRLYLAKSKREKKASGLLARDIDLDAGSIINNGSSIIGKNVNLKAHSGDIINKNGGDIYGSDQLGLYAVRDIKNIGSSIASDGSMVMAAGRNIENITESQRYGDEKNHLTTISKQSTIKAKGPLAMYSGGDLLNKGSSIESGDLQFKVFGNMINDSIEDSYSSEMVFNNGHRKEKSVVYKPATISASGSTSGFVAGNFALIGSRMSSAGDSDIKVGGKSMLISQVNSKMLDTHSEYTTSGIISDKDHVESHQSLKETLAESSLTAGGKNVLVNDGEQVLEEARGDAGVHLKGSKTSVLATRLRNMQSDYTYDEGTFTNSTDADGHDNTTHAHSSITGSEVVVDSEAIEADYIRQFGLKGSGGFSGFSHLFEDLSDTGLSDSNKPAWAKQAEASGKNINWNPLDDSSKSWSVHKEVLNQEFTTLVSLAAAVGTMWAGGFGVFGAGGATAGGTAGATAVVTNASMMSTIGTAMGQSALVGLASKGSVSLINNGFDLGKVAGDLTSKESLKSLGLNMATAGLTAGIGHGLGLKDIAPGMDMMDRTKILAKQAIISGAVRTGLAGATGDKPGQAWKDEALSIGLALAQSKIGDIAQDNSLKSGSIGKTALHSATGSLYSLSTGSNALSGAIGGATSELVAGVMESGKGTSGPPLTKEEQQNLNNKIKATTKLTSATVTMLAGGNAKDISTAANVGESAIEYNHKNHFGILANRGAQTEEEIAALEKASKLEDKTLTEKYLASTEGAKGLIPTFMKSAEDAAIECEYNDRFVDKTRIELAKIITPDLTAGLIQASGIQMRDEGYIAEPDALSSKFPAIKKMNKIGKLIGDSNAARNNRLGNNVSKIESVAPESKKGLNVESATKVRDALKDSSISKISESTNNKRIFWVDENASLSERAQRYNDSATGARSNTLTLKGQAPSLKYTDTNGKIKTVKFDGLEGNELIDKKISVVTSPKVKNQVLRQSQALKENNMQGVWEVPDSAQLKRAIKMMKELKVDNIKVRIQNEPVIK